MGKLVARATPVFCSFLALNKLIGSGRLLLLSRFNNPAPAKPADVLLGPAETRKNQKFFVNALIYKIRNNLSGYDKILTCLAASDVSR